MSTAWKKRETLWIIFSCTAVIAASLVMKDSLLSLTAALTGTLYTIFAGKGKRYCYFFGAANSVCYSILSFQWQLYGEMMLYGFYYLPMMFVGFHAWEKALDSRNMVRKTRLSNRGRVLTSALCLAGIILYGTILLIIGGRTPWLDSATNILSAAAMILTVKRCIEQWYIWFAVNALSIIMWANVWRTEGEASAIVVMYAVWMACAVIFYVDWRKELTNEKRCDSR